MACRFGCFPAVPRSEPYRDGYATHPDLAGKLSMSEASMQEQQGAGLKGLTETELLITGHKHH